jgi:hypothetical protein
MATESIFPVILNSTNFINKNTLRYKFPAGSISFKNASIALSNIQMYNSIQNIKATYSNNKIRIEHPFGGTETGVKTIDILIPDGSYEIIDINRLIQFHLVQNNCFLTDDKGRAIYYIQLTTNPTQYKIQLDLLDVPTSLPAGWTQGAFVFPEAGGASPSFTVYANFSKVIGMNPGTYFESRLSDFTPQVSPVSSLLLTCSLCRNALTNPDTILFSFVTGSTKYGSIMSINANDLIYNNVRDGTFHEMDISIIDQEYRPVEIVDTSLIIMMIIKFVH